VAWDRDKPLLGWDGPGVLVHGHTATVTLEDQNIEYSKGRIVYSKNRINVDCGLALWYVHDKSPDYAITNLAGLRLNDLKEFYYRDPAPAVTNDIYRNEILNMIKENR
jgi:hypothetical protein